MQFVGDSYTLPDRKAAALRTVNLVLRAMESTTNTRSVLTKFPGLALVAMVPGSCRGAIEARGRVFAVYGSTLYELVSNAMVSRGTLLTAAGRVGFAEGVLQVVLVDGPNGYVFNTQTDTYTQIASPGWRGSDTVAALNNRFIFHEPGTQTWYYSALLDGGDLDPTDLALSEAAPDDLIAVIASHQEVTLLGTRTKEVWYDAGAADFTFVRNTGATVEVGISAAHTLRKVDNGLMWIGRDENGTRGVMRADGYAPKRVSTLAIEDILDSCTDIAGAHAFTVGFAGLLMYVLCLPGLKTTLAFEASTGRWIELADIDSNGEFIAWRGVAHAYAGGVNYIFGADGGVYRLDPKVYLYGSDEIVCERRAPDDVRPLLARRFFGAFVAELEARDVPQEYNPQAELSWSDDGGYHFGNPSLRSLGRVGERPPRVLWARTGSGRDRVWRLRYSGPTAFAIINAGTEG